MFLNIQELVQEIESGKSTEEIVEERLAYLNSKEYQKNIVGLTGNYVDGSLTAHMYTWKKLLKLS